jgi:hypothetical protein
MINIHNKYVVIEGKDETRYGDVQITTKQKKKILFAVQNAVETRIRKDNDSAYVNAPSREIKKWFEARRI